MRCLRDKNRRSSALSAQAFRPHYCSLEEQTLGIA
jgi:hypothetical protein